MTRDTIRICTVVKGKLKTMAQGGKREFHAIGAEIAQFRLQSIYNSSVTRMAWVMLKTIQKL